VFGYWLLKAEVSHPCVGVGRDGQQLVEECVGFVMSYMEGEFSVFEVSKLCHKR
jgi:hypothetical protein